MADTLLFIHGTGVRKEGYDQTMALLRKNFKDILRIDIDGICWGPDLGVNVDAQAIEQVLPPTLMKAGEIGPEDIGVRAALWAELLRDPLLELRMASMRPPAADKQNSALPGVQAPDIALTSMLSSFAQKVSDPLPGEVEAQDVREATLWLIREPLLKSAAAAAGDPTDKDLVEAVARAIVAKTLVGYRGEMGVGPSALYVADDRDALVDAIVKSFPETKGLGSWLWAGVKALAEGAATYYGRDRRTGLMNGVSPGIGDILLYERRGDAILAEVEKRILALAEQKKRVIVLGHSLGGIMIVDLLSRAREAGPLPVTKLITVGSQAPVLFKFDALGTMRLKEALPAGSPYRPWLNIFDRNDFLSFCASRAFPGVTDGIEDFEVESNVSFPEAHSAYFRQPSFYSKIAESWPKP
jgi:pimeloyl-ACP methyl ester carboxylesterase